MDLMTDDETHDGVHRRGVQRHKVATRLEFKTIRPPPTSTKEAVDAKFKAKQTNWWLSPTDSFSHKVRGEKHHGPTWP